MKNIAFKRAVSNPSTKSFYHPDLIIHHWDASIEEERNFNINSNYEILPETEFWKEIAKNESLHIEFVNKKRAFEDSIEKALQAEAQILDEETRKLEAEFKQFQQWKKKAKR